MKPFSNYQCVRLPGDVEPGEPETKSIGSEETFDLTTAAIEVPGTSRMTRANSPVAAPENVKIIDEGDDGANEEGSADENNANEISSTNASEAGTPRSIDVRTNREEISSPTLVSVWDQQAGQVSVTDHSSVRSVQTRRSVDVSVINVGCERLNQITTSIPE